MQNIYSIDGVVPVIRPGSFVHPTAVLIGDVVIEENCYIGPHASLRGDMGRIHIGSGANVQDGCVLHCYPGRETVVESNGHIGHGAVLHGCRIENDALIGMNAVVLDGAVVGSRSLVGANSLVKAQQIIRSGWIATGTPAAEIRPMSDEDMAWKSNGTRLYQDLALRSLNTMENVRPLNQVEQDRPHLSVGRQHATPPHERSSKDA
ncbi:MAG: DapH/DapD/GlmU-related protein [Acidimicrobiales bacterium]